jgi:hypothetical protein
MHPACWYWYAPHPDQEKDFGTTIKQSINPPYHVEGWQRHDPRARIHAIAVNFGTSTPAAAHMWQPAEGVRLAPNLAADSGDMFHKPSFAVPSQNHAHQVWNWKWLMSRCFFRGFCLVQLMRSVYISCGGNRGCGLCRIADGYHVFWCTASSLNPISQRSKYGQHPLFESLNRTLSTFRLEKVLFVLQSGSTLKLVGTPARDTYIRTPYGVLRITSEIERLWLLILTVPSALIHTLEGLLRSTEYSVRT